MKLGVKVKPKEELIIEVGVILTNFSVCSNGESNICEPYDSYQSLTVREIFDQHLESSKRHSTTLLESK